MALCYDSMVDCGVFEHLPSKSPSTEDFHDSQYAWETLMNEIGGDVLSDGQEELYAIWQKLRHDEPQLLSTFESFLRKAVQEIRHLHKECDIAVKSTSGVYREEVKTLYEEMESHLAKERDSIRTKCEEQLRWEIERRLEDKDQEVQGLLQRKKELESSLSDLDKREKDRKSQNQQLEQMVLELSRHESGIIAENELLIKENMRLRERLDESLAGLNETQQLCLQLQDDAVRERTYIEREYTEAILEHERKSKERQNLELQLEKLRDKYERLVEETYTEPRLNIKKLTDLSSSSDCECDQQLQFLQLRTPDRCFKIVLCGDSGVGKTSFLERFCQNTFNARTQVTIEIGFQMKSLVIDSTVISLQIWDTAGQERFRSIPHSYFRKADGVMLLYDITCEKSFQSVTSWMVNIQEGDLDSSAIIALIGNKEDLSNPLRVVSTESGQRLADDCGAIFVETSAKTGANIFDAFDKMARMLQRREDETVKTVYTVDINDNKMQKKKSKCCL
ncbi:EF-hand calcium-binding domain-containing protein 4B-like [Ptychodera flava]|uniref:EF-hand calcium-binding domain-containing protein 4B-like n=1 Tax=Ptychodera flava TaxID=63121 RepID=UPI00396A5117